MDDAPRSQPTGPVRPGRLTRDEAVAMLASGDAALRSGDFADAALRFTRVIGFDDAAVTGAALLGLGEARYRLDDERAAVAAWEQVLRLPESPATYPALRNVAAARVRTGDLLGAIEAYREADRRAPDDDKAEIASRLGWLVKETGDPKGARRYFARARGDGPLVSVVMVLLAATVIVSLTALLSGEGRVIFEALWLDKAALAAGEYWRLLTVTLLHGSLLHLGFNMYALYIVGPIVERWYGPVRFLLFYVACAAGGSVASFVTSDVTAVGASGAIFGLFGMLLVSSRVHHPVDRQSRMLVRQLGMLIVINIIFGFAVPGIDNAAHLGGLATGAFLGFLVPPTRVQTMATLWQRPDAAGTAHRASVPALILPMALAVVGGLVVLGLVVGTAARLG
ncbi:MAG: rhomboid family intramembrane serine protease [Candidatus Limnocylindria bacterium]